MSYRVPQGDGVWAVTTCVDGRISGLGRLAIVLTLAGALGCPRTSAEARGADFAQLDLRLAKKIKLSGNMRASNFGQPTEFAGDFQRGEQRLFQLGARFEF